MEFSEIDSGRISWNPRLPCPGDKALGVGFSPSDSDTLRELRTALQLRLAQAQFDADETEVIDGPATLSVSVGVCEGTIIGVALLSVAVMVTLNLRDDSGELSAEDAQFLGSLATEFAASGEPDDSPEPLPI